MKKRPVPNRSGSDTALMEAAEKFIGGSTTWAAIQDASKSYESLAEAEKDPEAFFAKRGANLPEGLSLDVFGHRPRQLPGPDWFPFVLEFHSCRTYWVRECDDSSPPKCELKERTVCFGFRIRPRFISPIG